MTLRLGIGNKVMIPTQVNHSFFKGELGAVRLGAVRLGAVRLGAAWKQVCRSAARSQKPTCLQKGL